MKKAPRKRGYTTVIRVEQKRKPEGGRPDDTSQMENDWDCLPTPYQEDPYIEFSDKHNCACKTAKQFAIWWNHRVLNHPHKDMQIAILKVPNFTVKHLKLQTIIERRKAILVGTIC